jgi:hypothetical protein
MSTPARPGSLPAVREIWEQTSGGGRYRLELVHGELELGRLGVVRVAHVHPDDAMTGKDATVLDDEREDDTATVHPASGSGAFGSRYQ